VGHESQGRQAAEYPEELDFSSVLTVKPERLEGKGLSRPGDEWNRKPSQHESIDGGSM